MCREPLLGGLEQDQPHTNREEKMTYHDLRVYRKKEEKGESKWRRSCSSVW